MQFGLVAAEESRRVVLPLKAVRCGFAVEGGLAEVTVTQVFFQDNRAPLDCLYQFPLPADASVHVCEVLINDRVIRARVEERKAARKLVARKKAQGHRTALVEAERENLFTLSLGNLQPQDLIEVRLTYIQPLRRSAGKLSLEVPFCPGIRYIPGRPLLRTNRGKGLEDDTDQVPDASRISPPRIDQFHPDAAFIEISGRIEGGFAEVSSITSPSHRITAQSRGGYLEVRQEGEGDVPDRDFVLRWKERPAAATEPRAWVWEKDGESYALMEVRAPESSGQAAILPQDVYFLVDRSGSMEGQKWQKAVEALQSCVGVLAAQDRATVTLFESGFIDFAEAPLPPQELLADRNFRNLAQMGTAGGTELGPALAHVLELVRKHSGGRRANVVLVTDAQVGNEREILKMVKKAPGLALHCFGIDIALNDALLLALTRQQGGTFHSLNPNEDIRAAVSALGQTLRQPVLLDLRLSKGWETADLRLPDLYAGQVHYACAKGRSKDAPVISARDGAGQKVTLPFKTFPAGNAGPYLHWCKTRIQRLLAENASSAAAVKLSKAVNLICELTAFVAWDEVEKVAVATHELTQPNMLFDAGCGPTFTHHACRADLCFEMHACPPAYPVACVLKPRPAVVVVMGQAGHGKTTLINALRNPDAAPARAGEATQGIEAWSIAIPCHPGSGGAGQVTLLDTPGHAPLVSMRHESALVADLLLLVIAANEGFMPQTVEAIEHARDAKIPIVVAITKTDHPNANPARVRQQLLEMNLVAADAGGDTLVAEVSAVTMDGVHELIGDIEIQADLLNLKGDPTRIGKANVLASCMESGDPVALMLVRNGTFRTGDTVQCREFSSRIRAMTNDAGAECKEAGPSAVVKVLGLSRVPDVGVLFTVV